MRYATTTDLQAEPWSLAPVPPQAGRLLLLASAAVGRATLTARYPTERDGAPRIGSPAEEAMRDATCAQVMAWVSSGIDPTQATTTTRVAASKSLGSGSISYADTGQQLADVDALRSGELGSEARTILAAAGLLNGRVAVLG